MGEKRAGRQTGKIKMKVTQQQRLRVRVNSACVAGELPLHNTEWQCNLIYTSNLMWPLAGEDYHIRSMEISYVELEMMLQSRDTETEWNRLTEWHFYFLSMESPLCVLSSVSWCFLFILFPPPGRSHSGTKEKH